MGSQENFKKGSGHVLIDILKVSSDMMKNQVRGQGDSQCQAGSC